jgi:hypothetical protein
MLGSTTRIFGYRTDRTVDKIYSNNPLNQSVRALARPVLVAVMPFYDVLVDAPKLFASSNEATAKA